MQSLGRSSTRPHQSRRFLTPPIRPDTTIRSPSPFKFSRIRPSPLCTLRCRSWRAASSPHAVSVAGLRRARHPDQPLDRPTIYSFVARRRRSFLGARLGHRDVLHLVGAQSRRPHAEPARAQPRRADRAAPVAGRRDQAADQGRPASRRTPTSCCSASRRTSRSRRRSRRSWRCRSGRT